LTPLLTSRSLRCPGFLVNPTTTLTVAVWFLLNRTSGWVLVETGSNQDRKYNQVQ
jgi:hypothetical protein